MKIEMKSEKIKDVVESDKIKDRVESEREKRLVNDRVINEKISSDREKRLPNDRVINEKMKERQRAAIAFLAQISLQEKPFISPTLESCQGIPSGSFIRIWKRRDLDSSILNSQFVCVSFGAPIGMFSILASGKVKQKKQRQNTFEKLSSFKTNIVDYNTRKRDSSFAHLLEPMGILVSEGYDPNYLDNPDLKAIRHKTIITLPFFLGSILQPSKPSDISKEINEHFRETHPNIDDGITLTSIRSLKSKLLLVAQNQNVELSSVALAYVYLEKLILKNFVKESNLALVGASKINDPKELEYRKVCEAFEQFLDISKKDVYSNEFSVYAALEFTLFLPLCDISSHLNRILSSTDYGDMEGYFGPNEFYLNSSSAHFA